MLLRLFLVASMLALWFAVTPTTGSACSCADPGTPSEALAESALVFQGKVASISPPVTEGMLQVQFDVATVWKGPDAQTITLTTHEQSPACGYPFESRVEYVVYSHDATSVNLCSRTAPLALAGEDLAAFAQLGQPTDGPGFPNSGNGGIADPEPGPDRLKPVLVVGLSSALMLGFAGARLLRGRHASRQTPATVDRT